MKKMFLLSLALILSQLPLAAQTLTLTSPNGGENWTIGSTATITWNASGVTTVRLILHKGGTGAVNRLGIIAQGLNAASGSYSWTVGSYDTGTAGPGNDYYIRLKAEGADVEDFNNAVFALSAAPQPHFTLFSPNGGESWEKGSDRSISWEAVNMPVNFRLQLLKDGQVQGTIQDNLSPGNGAGAIPWKAGDYIGGSASVMGGGYKVRIESVDGLYSDNSDNAFMITAPPLVMQFPMETKPDLRRLAANWKPDLVVCAEWTSKRPPLGAKRTITVKVKNIGLADAAATNFDLYVEGHGTETLPLPALARNAEYSYAHKFSWNSLGHKTVRITVDPANQVVEANENNNQVSGSIEVILMGDAYGVLNSRCSDQK